MPNTSYSINININNDVAYAVVLDRTTGSSRIIRPDHAVEDYEDGPKWSGRDEWLGDFWAKVRDTYDS